MSTEKNYLGKWRGIVVDNNDPLKLGRIKAIVPDLGGQTILNWALPCSPNRGFILLPKKGASVWIEFEAPAFSINNPIWAGEFWHQGSKSDMPSNAQDSYPNNQVIKTPGGHLLEFDDTPGKEYIRLQHSTGHAIELSVGGIFIHSVGVIEIEGLNTVINGRKVNPSSQVI